MAECRALDGGQAACCCCDYEAVSPRACVAAACLLPVLRCAGRCSRGRHVQERSPAWWRHGGRQRLAGAGASAASATRQDGAAPSKAHRLRPHSAAAVVPLWPAAARSANAVGAAAAPRWAAARARLLLSCGAARWQRHPESAPLVPLIGGPTAVPRLSRCCSGSCKCHADSVSLLGARCCSTSWYRPWQWPQQGAGSRAEHAQGCCRGCRCCGRRCGLLGVRCAAASGMAPCKRRAAVAALMLHARVTHGVPRVLLTATLVLWVLRQSQELLLLVQLPVCGAISRRRLPPREPGLRGAAACAGRLQVWQQLLQLLLPQATALGWGAVGRVLWRGGARSCRGVPWCVCSVEGADELCSCVQSCTMHGHAHNTHTHTHLWSVPDGSCAASGAHTSPPPCSAVSLCVRVG
jgi:hypothetical protein